MVAGSGITKLVATTDRVQVYADFWMTNEEAAKYVAMAKEDNPGMRIDVLRLHVDEDGGVTGWVMIAPERFRRLGHRFEEQ